MAGASEEVGGEKRLLLPLLAYKVFFLALIPIGALLLPDFFYVGSYRANFHWPVEKVPTIVEHFTTWDGEHYLYLAERWYKAGEDSVAFYPLWPATVGALGRLTGSFWSAGLLLANLFSLLGVLLLHRLVAMDASEDIADWTAIFLMAFPGALFFQLPYTESLFLLLAVLLFYGLRTGDDRIVAVAGLLLPLTRVIGLLCWFPLVLHYWLARRRPKWYALLAIPIGFAIYLGVMYAATGDALAGFAAQKRFIGQGTVWRLFDVVGFVKAFFTPAMKLHGFLNSAIDRFFFVVLLAALIPIARRSKTWLAYALVAGVIPAVTGAFMSYTRFLAVVFPVFIVAAELFEKRRMWRMVVLAVLFSLQLLFLLRHTNFYWAG